GENAGGPPRRRGNGDRGRVRGGRQAGRRRYRRVGGDRRAPACAGRPRGAATHPRRGGRGLLRARRDDRGADRRRGLRGPPRRLRGQAAGGGAHVLERGAGPSAGAGDRRPGRVRDLLSRVGRDPGGGGTAGHGGDRRPGDALRADDAPGAIAGTHGALWGCPRL
ncbi:MAG: hypothetical protein AVDCRST_MAG73-909, partial [uncultured Thermomicrobiales bacterium]